MSKIIKVRHGTKYNPKVVIAYYRSLGLPAPKFDYVFHPTRKWELDLAWPDYKVGVEVNGGVFTGGRHARGPGIVSAMEKKNALNDLDWVVYECQPKDVCMLEFASLVVRKCQERSGD